MIRALLVLAFAAFVLLALYGMRRGWRNRLAAQSGLPALPVPPADLGAPELSATGLYVGSAFATSWQDRVVHDGLGARADAVASLHDAGLLIERQASTPVFVPRVAWVAARLAPGLAGKVLGEGGLLVLRWRLGDREIDTAFRADDKTSYPEWVTTINAKVHA